ncbi:serine/threonine-protein kinase [Nonomuraea sp. NPDC049419]|uniref:WD40 repeat domain-containing serine/threonine protein kinase n=1 Tax=Nonomuraea sp. NPDC049419 TaxID=3155772 RepID=UPI00342EE568
MPDIRPLRPADPVRIGDHRLVGVLGSGGQGTVYRGVDGAGREVAVKLLHSHLAQDGDVMRGFLREVEAARRVAAFCTAAVLDVGMLDDRPYIVSEYVPGDTLLAVVRASGPRTGGALHRLATSTLTALTAIHQAGIVHRDFKPGNVLMGPDGPVVIDFGIARALDATTATSGAVGTPAYMSPEQFRGERVGPASDVFSWAGTMVFAATGRPPFRGEALPVIMNGILSGDPDLTGVPSPLHDLIASCLVKDPAARPSPTDLLSILIRPAPAADATPPPVHAAGGADVPDRGRKVGRRVLIGGVVAAALGGSALLVLRPDDGLAGRTDGGMPASPAVDGRGSGTPAATPSATPSPGTSSSASSGSAEPFGTEAAEPAALPRGSAGDPTALAASGSTVVCGTAKGVLFGWDMRAPATRLGDGGEGVTSVAAGTLDGRTVVVSGHEDGRMRLWDASGKRLAGHRAEDRIRGVTVAGRAVAVSEKYDLVRDLHSLVRLWDVATGEQVGPGLSDHYQGMKALTFGRLDGDDLLVTGDGANRVRLWRLSSGTLMHSFTTGEVGGIELVACGELKGEPVLVSTHLDATLRVYDLATGERRKRWAFSSWSPDDRGVTALTAGLWGDTPIAVAAHAPSGKVTVRVWNLNDGEVIGVLGLRDERAIYHVAIAELDGRPVVAGSDERGALHVWSLGPS